MFDFGTNHLFTLILLLFCVKNSLQAVYNHSQALQLLNEAGIEIEVASSGNAATERIRNALRWKASTVRQFTALSH
jgi:hypothetical protein